MSAPAPGPRRVHLVAPALLALAALAQLALARAGPLTPWKGGGFGLFSCVDKLEDRVLLVWRETPGGDEPLPVHQRDHQVLEALAFPSQRLLQRLGERLAAEQEGGGALRIEVWKRAFDRASGQCRRELVGSRRVPR